MSHHIRLALLFVTFVFSNCLHGFARDKLPQEKLPQEKLPQVKVEEKQPVRVSVSETSLTESGKSTLTLTLHIEPGVAIYTNDPYEGKPEFEYLIPIEIEFLDSNDKPVETEFQFPRGTLISGLMGGNYVYTNAVPIAASFPGDVAVEKLTLKYHGYRYSDNILGNGYC